MVGGWRKVKRVDSIAQCTDITCRPEDIIPGIIWKLKEPSIFGRTQGSIHDHHSSFLLRLGSGAQEYSTMHVAWLKPMA